METIYRAKKMYFVTITPPYRLNKPEFIYNEDKYMIRRYFNRFSHHFCFYPEFSESCRLHYHGIVEVHDMRKFYNTKYLIDKSIGFSRFDRLKTFKDHLRTVLYCRKDYGLIKDQYDPIIFHNLKRVKCKQHDNLDSGIGILKWFPREPSSS